MEIIDIREISQAFRSPKVHLCNQQVMCQNCRFFVLLLLETQTHIPQMRSCRDRKLSRMGQKIWAQYQFEGQESADFLTFHESSLKEEENENLIPKPVVNRSKAKHFCLNCKNQKHLVQNQQKLLSEQNCGKLASRHLCVTSPFPH